MSHPYSTATTTHNVAPIFDNSHHSVHHQHHHQHQHQHRHHLWQEYNLHANCNAEALVASSSSSPYPPPPRLIAYAHNQPEESRTPPSPIVDFNSFQLLTPSHSQHQPTHSTHCLSSACNCNKKSHTAESAFSLVGSKEMPTKETRQATGSR